MVNPTEEIDRFKFLDEGAAGIGSYFRSTGSKDSVSNECFLFLQIHIASSAWRIQRRFGDGRIRGEDGGWGRVMGGFEELSSECGGSISRLLYRYSVKSD